MDILLNIIDKLNKIERNIFFDDLFASKDETQQCFLNILQHATIEDKKIFYKDLNQKSIAWWENRLEKASQISLETIEKSKDKILSMLKLIPFTVKEMQKSTEKAKKLTLKNREFLKSKYMDLDHIISEQDKGIETPPIEKEYDKEKLIYLKKPNKKILKTKNIFDCIANRKSRRSFNNSAISLDELSYLLWATQGVTKLSRNKKITLRTVPSGAARHSFETYLAVLNVDTLEKGIYRYNMLQHAIIKIKSIDNLNEKIVSAALNQSFVKKSSVFFIWSSIPYRSEWKFSIEAAKIILLDCGHLCQNLYLATESLNIGMCAIAAYNQTKMDKIIAVDGENEFSVYAAAVGKIDN